MSAQPSPAPEHPSPGEPAAGVSELIDKMNASRRELGLPELVTHDQGGTFGLVEQHERTLQHDLPRPTVQRPALGRIVHVLVHPTLNNGSDVAAAVVTRVWQMGHDGTWIVNLRVWLDGTNRSHEWATSVHLHADEAQARKEWVELTARIHGFEAEHVVGVSRFAFWPPRS